MIFSQIAFAICMCMQIVGYGTEIVETIRADIQHMEATNVVDDPEVVERQWVIAVENGIQTGLVVSEIEFTSSGFIDLTPKYGLSFDQRPEGQSPTQGLADQM